MREGQDLFGQVRVTWPEVVDWMARVHGITPVDPRFPNFCRTWRVAEKIAESKLRGTWWDSGFLPPSV